jgi:hypothetical protein
MQLTLHYSRIFLLRRELTIRYCDMTPESCNLPTCCAGFAEDVPVAIWNMPLFEHVSTATITS